MPKDSFPSNTDQLTTQWLTRVLREKGVLNQQDSVSGFQVAPIEEPGQTAEVYRISLIYAGDARGAPPTLVAKFPTAFEPARKLAQQYSIYIKEVRFYQELADQVPDIVPLCYAAEADLQTHDFVLLMEDLGDLHCRDIYASKVADVALALDRLATLHAQWWDHPTLPTLDWAFRRDDAEFSLLAKMTLAGILPTTKSQFNKYLSNSAWSTLQKVLDLWDQIRAYHPTPFTICHGDCHLKQMMFPGDKGGRFVLLDWQTININWAAADVARLLITGLSPKDRRQHERSLVERYHRALQAQGISDLPINSLWFLIRLSSIDSYLINATACLQTDISIFQAITEKHGIDCIEVLLGRVGAAIDDWNLSEAIDRFIQEAHTVQVMRAAAEAQTWSVIYRDNTEHLSVIGL